MDQNLRELFDRALDDEPVPPPGDQAQAAMAAGTRLRRRRTLGLSGVAGGLAVALAAIVVLNVTAPDRSTVQEAAVAVPKPVCVAAGQSATDLDVYLKPDIAAGQREALDQYLSTSPDVRSYTFEDREQAFERFKALWRDDPDFVTKVDDDLAESFRIEMASPQRYPVLRDQLRNQAGVETVVGWSCPAGATPGPAR